jgi:hypothetical protein
MCYPIPNPASGNHRLTLSTLNFQFSTVKSQPNRPKAEKRLPFAHYFALSRVYFKLSLASMLVNLKATLRRPLDLLLGL